MIAFLASRGADTTLPMPAKDELVNSLFKEIIEDDSAGAAVLVAQDGKALFKKGYGSASLEPRVPISPETKFRIGSITKQITAAAILKLQEGGLLKVTDKLSTFIPDYPRGDEVTLHHLLTHTSGIHNCTEKPEMSDTTSVYIEPADQIKSFKNDSYGFSPGDRWHYSNSGYFLLGYIIEKISGESYADYLKHHIFAPLGMQNTGVHQRGLSLEHEAIGYRYKRGAFREAKNLDLSQVGGAGALYSTVEDLFRWNEAIFNGKLLNDDSLKLGFTPVTLNNGEPPGDNLMLGLLRGGYGYGWVISEERGLPVIKHGGGLTGFVSHLARYRDQQFTVTVLVNANPEPPRLNPETLAREIAQIYLWDKMEQRESFAVDQTVDANVYDAYVGRYDFLSRFMTISKEGNRLFEQLSGNPMVELYPKSNTFAI